MRSLRARRVVVAVALAAAAALVLLVVALEQGWGESEPVVSRGDRLFVDADVTPRSHLFGDPLTARVDLVFNRAFIRPESVRVRARFRPFRIERAMRTRSDHGDSTRLAIVYRLSCLRRECVASGPQKKFDFRPALVSYRVRGAASSAEVFWPSVSVASRVGGAELFGPALRASVRPLPETTYRIDPTLLAALALAGAFVLVLVATALVAPQLPRSLGLRLPAWLRPGRRPRTPLELALDRVRAASANGRGDERRALENLALELSLSGSDDLARNARRLAWSPRGPHDGELDELAGAVVRLIRETR